VRLETKKEEEEEEGEGEEGKEVVKQCKATAKMRVLAFS
jgi:hypothetical protein